MSKVTSPYIRHAANIITAVRIALSLMLPFFAGDRITFFIVFCICGASDLLDGIIARRTHTQSILGARLDSVADLLLFLITLGCIIYWAGAAIWDLLPYVIAAALLRFTNIAIAYAKFRVFAVIHTWANKAVGLLVFASFGAYILTGLMAAIIPLCAFAALSALEESVILLSSKRLDPDRKSIFIK